MTRISTRQFFTWAAMPVVVLGLSGCRDAETPPMAHSENAPHHEMKAAHDDSGDMNHDGMKMEHPKPRQEPAESVALPEDFPADVPVYPGARVAVSSGTVDGATIGMETEDDRQKVVRYYEKELAARGWKLSETNSSKFRSVLQGKKDTRSCAITVIEATKLRKTSISLIIMR